MEKKSFYGRDIINIRFSYNGDLGILQQKTKDNIETINMLQFVDLIGAKEAGELRKECRLYYQEEIKQAAESPGFFIDF
jgi:hypothetical protein